MLTSADALRRWIGLFCLVVAGGMLIWGEIILQPHLKGWVAILYWSGCFLLTIMAMIIALLDIRAVRRRGQEERARLMQQTLRDLQPPKSDPPEPPPS